MWYRNGRNFFSTCEHRLIHAPTVQMGNVIGEFKLFWPEHVTTVLSWFSAMDFDVSGSHTIASPHNAKLLLRRPCWDMRVDMCIAMCIAMCFDMCVDMCVNMCVDTKIWLDFGMQVGIIELGCIWKGGLP